MSLVVEDGTGLSTAQSYLSVADCDAYNLLHANDATWIAALTAAKEIALIRATQYLDNQYRNRWRGARVQESQALAWPRANAEDYDGYYYDSTELPQTLKDATAECAIKYASSTDMLPDLTANGVIESQTVGPISITYAGGKSPNASYQLVAALVRDLVTSAGSVNRG